MMVDEKGKTQNLTLIDFLACLDWTVLGFCLGEREPCLEEALMVIVWGRQFDGGNCEL